MQGFLKSSGIYFDTKPKEGSLNAVTSGGIFKAIQEGGGGGGGGTSDYALLANKPKINGVELTGNKSLASLGIASRSDLTTVEDKIEDINADITDLNDNKADKSDIPDISNLATKTELQATNDRMTQAETDIDTLETAIDGKASTASVTALDGRMTQAETDIDTLETAIDGKASTASVTALDGRMTHAETDIDTLETAIDGKASTASVTALDGRVTQAETDIDTLQSDKEDKLTVTNGSWANSTYVTAGTFSWRKYGRLVIVYVNGVMLTSWTDGDKTLSTNAGPKPAVRTFASISPLNNSGTSQLFSVGTDGKVTANGGMSQSGEFFGSFSYIAAE